MQVFLVIDGWYAYLITVSESSISNTCHRIRNSDGGEALANSVFVYCFISAFYALKGRKVKS